MKIGKVHLWALGYNLFAFFIALSFWSAVIPLLVLVKLNATALNITIPASLVYMAILSLMWQTLLFTCLCLFCYSKMKKGLEDGNKN